MGKGARAQQMTLGTIILIVLGIAALVFLIYGFSTGWGNLWDRVTNVGGQGTNLDTIVKSCDGACSLERVNEFCYVKRDVLDVDGKKFPATCYELALGGAHNVEQCAALESECAKAVDEQQDVCEEDVCIEQRVGDDYIFEIAGGEKHRMTLKDFDERTATYEVASDPVIIEIPWEKSRKIDIDGDGFVDIEVTPKYNPMYGVRDDTARILTGVDDYSDKLEVMELDFVLGIDSDTLDPEHKEIYDRFKRGDDISFGEYQKLKWSQSAEGKFEKILERFWEGEEPEYEDGREKGEYEEAFKQLLTIEDRALYENVRRGEDIPYDDAKRIALLWNRFYYKDEKVSSSECAKTNLPEWVCSIKERGPVHLTNQPYENEEGEIIPSGPKAVHHALRTLGYDADLLGLDKERKGFFGSVLRGIGDLVDKTFFDSDTSEATFPWELKNLVEEQGFEIDSIWTSFVSEEDLIQRMAEEYKKGNAVIVRVIADPENPLTSQRYVAFDPYIMKQSGKMIYHDGTSMESEIKGVYIIKRKGADTNGNEEDAGGVAEEGDSEDSNVDSQDGKRCYIECECKRCVDFKEPNMCSVTAKDGTITQLRASVIPPLGSSEFIPCFDCGEKELVPMYTTLKEGQECDKNTLESTCEDFCDGRNLVAPRFDRAGCYDGMVRSCAYEYPPEKGYTKSLPVLKAGDLNPTYWNDGDVKGTLELLEDIEGLIYHEFVEEDIKSAADAR